MIDIEAGRVIPRVVIVFLVGALIFVLLRHEINKAQQNKDSEVTSSLRSLHTNFGSNGSGHARQKRSMNINETTQSNSNGAQAITVLCSVDWYLFLLLALAAAAILLACGGLLYGSNCRRRPDDFSPDKWWMSGDDDMLWNFTSLTHYRSKQLNKSDVPEVGRLKNGESTPLMSTSAYRNVVTAEVDPLQTVNCNLNLFQELPIICAPTNIRKVSKSVT